MEDPWIWCNVIDEGRFDFLVELLEEAKEHESSSVMEIVLRNGCDVSRRLH
jgi:hypothetical protein